MQPTEQKCIEGGNRQPDPHIPFPSSGSYPVRAGNAVRPLVDGVPAFHRINEAIEEARHRVWLTVAFFADDFRMPGGSLFDVLDRAVARGLDVRVIFWRPNPESSRLGRTFAGSQADRDMLAAVDRVSEHAEIEHTHITCIIRKAGSSMRGSQLKWPSSAEST